MVTISAAEARDSNEPLSPVSTNRADAVVPSSAEHERLTARRRGAKAGFAKHLFVGVDLNGLLDTGLDDVLEGYG